MFGKWNLGSGWIVMIAVVCPMVGSAPVGLAQTFPVPQASAVPLSRPLPLNWSASPNFDFAGEVVNSGVAIPNNPRRVVFEGVGYVAAGPRLTAWHLQFDRVTLDDTVLAAAEPLASLTVLLDNAPGGNGRSYNVWLDGLMNSPHAAFPGAERIIKSVANTTAQLLFEPPHAPVANRAPVLDFNSALQHHVALTMGGARLARPVPPATVLGAVRYLGRPALLAAQSGPLVVLAYGQQIALQTELQAVVDVATAIPVLVSARASGNTPIPVAGRIDYALRLALAVDGMPDPMETLTGLRQGPQSAPAAAAAAAPPRPAQAGFLTGRQIMEEWGDKTLDMTSGDGSRKFTARLGKDGRASLSGGLVDSGTWRTIDNGYCVTWQKLRNGQEACLKVRKEGAVYKIFTDDGRLSASGTAASAQQTAQSAAPSAAAPPRPAQAGSLTGRQIMEEWGDKTLDVTSGDGSRTFVARFGRDGRASLSGGLVDSGTWRVIDNGYCAKWEKLRNGQEACLTVKKEGDAYKAYYENGQLGAISRVRGGQPAAPAARPAAQPAPTAAPKPADPAAGDVQARLLRLKTLHEQGLISKEEYETRRKAILDSL